MAESEVDLVQHPFLQAVVNSLQNMDKNFVTLSRLRWGAIDDKVLIRELVARNIQERPFAYEFYHQMRKLWDGDQASTLGLDKLAIQAEVNKSYQDIPKLRKMPDFLVHRVNSPDEGDQFAVFEFKVASRLQDIEDDLRKLINFQHLLKYSYGIEVIIGPSGPLKKIPAILDQIDEVNCWPGSSYNLIIVYFSIDSWTATVKQREYTL